MSLFLTVFNYVKGGGAKPSVGGGGALAEKKRSLNCVNLLKFF